MSVTFQLPPSADPAATLSQVVASLAARGVSFYEVNCYQNEISGSGVDYVGSSYPGVDSWPGYLSLGVVLSGRYGGFTAPYITSELTVRGGPPHLVGPNPPSPTTGDCPKGLRVPSPGGKRPNRAAHVPGEVRTTPQAEGRDARATRVSPVG